MIPISYRFKKTLWAAWCATILVWANAGVVCSGAVEKSDVFVSGRDGYHTYRIPSILRAANGDLLAFAEGRKNSGGDSGDIDLLVKRSTDGGQSWTSSLVIWNDADNTCGNPCPVLDRTTGVIWLLMTHNPGSLDERLVRANAGASTRTVWLTSSRDHGATWEKVREITDTTKNAAWQWYATGPGIGIQVQAGPHAGRLVIPCDHSYNTTEKSGEHGAHVIFSDDHGVTWQMGGTIRPGMNECQVVELHDGDGTLLIDMRSYRGRSVRAESRSKDGGVTWTKPQDALELVEPVCQASIVQWDQKCLLFSNPAAPKKRVKMTVRLSEDDAATWPQEIILHDGPAAYSCLVDLGSGKAACLYENGVKKPYERITFALFARDDFRPIQKKEIK